MSTDTATARSAEVDQQVSIPATDRSREFRDREYAR